MTVLMLSNYYTHHQSELSNALNTHSDVKCFLFVETEPMEEERRQMGWGFVNKPDFVFDSVFFNSNRELIETWVIEADVVIIGSAPYDLVKKRLKQGKLTFFYSERIYKKGYEAYKFPVRFVRFLWRYGRFKSAYLLCASAFTAADYAKTYTFLNKTYKWGYFPKTHHYEDLDGLFEKKEPASILWAARFLDWKHPEYVVEIARRLKEENYNFRIKMLGNGELWDAIAQQVKDLDLCEQVQLTGAVPAEEVRGYMDAASIFLFTSDRNEGWGAVLNESMNSGCAVVADRAIGSVPFLLEDGVNGMTYNTYNVDELYAKVKYLLDHPQVCKDMGKKAYETVTGLWNAETAAERLLNLSQSLLQGQKYPQLYESGPCSKAEILKDW